MKSAQDIKRGKGVRGLRSPTFPAPASGRIGLLCRERETVAGREEWMADGDEEEEGQGTGSLQSRSFALRKQSLAALRKGKPLPLTRAVLWVSSPVSMRLFLPDMT